jgi:putative oxidoreductase
MKKLFSVNQNSNTIDMALLVARIGIAGLMLTHGLPKMVQLFSGAPVEFPAVLGLGAQLSLGLAVFAEVFCSLLLLTGFGTRLAVVPLIITMLVAVLSIHAADPFAVKEMAIHYLLVYVVLFFTGSGKYSVDYLVQHKTVKKNTINIEAEDPTLSIYQ